MSQDLIGLRGGMNLFEYAPNPILWVDPLGLSSFSCNKLTVCGCKEILKSENVIMLLLLVFKEETLMAQQKIHRIIGQIVLKTTHLKQEF